MQVWNVLHAGNTGRKNDEKNRHLGTIIQLCRAESSQLRHVLTIGKKLVKQQYLIHMFPQYGKLWPSSGWDLLASLGHHGKFQQVSHLGFVTAATSFTGGQPNFARCLAISWAATLYIDFQGFLPPDGIAPHAKFTLHRSLAFSYIGSVNARHSSSRASQTLRHGTRNGITEILHRAPPICGWVAITLGIGPHSSYFDSLKNKQKANLFTLYTVSTEAAVILHLPQHQQVLLK